MNLNIDKRDWPEAQHALVCWPFSFLLESSLAVSQLPQSAPPFDPEERFHDPFNDLEILGNLNSDSATDGDVAGGGAIEVSQSERLSR